MSQVSGKDIPLPSARRSMRGHQVNPIARDKAQLSYCKLNYNSMGAW